MNIAFAAALELLGFNKRVRSSRLWIAFALEPVEKRAVAAVSRAVRHHVPNRAVRRGEHLSQYFTSRAKLAWAVSASVCWTNLIAIKNGDHRAEISARFLSADEILFLLPSHHSTQSQP